MAQKPDTVRIQVVIENAVPVFEQYRYWILMIEGPDGAPLAVGSYLNAERYAFASPGHPGFDFSGNFRGANTLTEYDGVGDLSSLVLGVHAVRRWGHEQRCLWQASLRRVSG